MSKNKNIVHIAEWDFQDVINHEFWDLFLNKFQKPTTTFILDLFKPLKRNKRSLKEIGDIWDKLNKEEKYCLFHNDINLFLYFSDLLTSRKFSQLKKIINNFNVNLNQWLNNLKEYSEMLYYAEYIEEQEIQQENSLTKFLEKVPNIPVLAYISDNFTMISGNDNKIIKDSIMRMLLSGYNHPKILKFPDINRSKDIKIFVFDTINKENHKIINGLN